MKKQIIVLIALLIALCTTWQAQAQQQDSILLHMGGYPLTLKDFVETTGYTPSADEATLEEALGRYINYRLQLMEAQALGLHQDSSVLAELGGYHRQLVPMFLNRDSARAQVAHEVVYARMQQEVHASHLLIAVKDWNNLEAAQAARLKADSLRALVLAGADFAALAREHSDDPSAAQNSGDLGYFTAPQMTGPFEDAAYSLPVGELSAPVRTKFGYHLIQVHHRGPSRGARKISHIMLRTRPGMPAEDSVAKASQAQEIYQALQAGHNWDSLCRIHTQHENSKYNGGQLEWFWVGKMPAAIEAAAYGLAQAGDYAAPIHSPYGWHIIKLDSARPMQGYNALKPAIMAQLKEDSSRRHLIEAAYYTAIQANAQYTASEALEQLFGVFDSTLLQGQWRFAAKDTALLNVPMGHLGQSPVPARHFYAFARRRQAANPFALPEYINMLYTAWLQHNLQAWAEARLEHQRPSYRSTMQQYTEAVLATEVLKRAVWEAAAHDSTGLAAYFEANPGKYVNHRWPARARVLQLNGKDSAQVAMAALVGQLPEFTVKAWTKEPLYFHPADSIISLPKRITLRKAVELLEITPGGKLQVTHRHAPTLPQTTRAHYKRLVHEELLRLGATASQLVFKELPANHTLIPQSAKFTVAVSGHGPVALQLAHPGLSAQLTLYTDINLPPTAAMAEGSYWSSTEGRHQCLKVLEVLPARPKTLEEIRGVVIKDYQEAYKAQWLKTLRSKYKVKVNKKAKQLLVVSG